MKEISAFIFFLVANICFSQKLPLIHANSVNIRVRDGDNYYTSTLTSSTKKKPLQYSSPNKNKKVTFYTDRDSLSFTLKQDKDFNFVVLLNNSDSIFVNMRQGVDHEWTGWLKALKKAKEYKPNDPRPLPTFSYQTQYHFGLMAIKKEFKLDSIAGSGNEESKLLNLMHWVHDGIPHDGQHENPTLKNALNLVPLCKNENRGLNCRGLATVLNECYLAMNFKSRMVTCYPKDSTDYECHVINMVYSNSLKKWLWMDPTNNAFVMNDKGELQSIEEVRERLIAGKPVTVNPDANWNHKRAVTTEAYLYNYMAKNLYRFECAVKSDFDAETIPIAIGMKGKIIEYVELLPLDYFNQKPDKTETLNKENGTTIVEYKTNDVILFWKAPY